MIAKIRNRHVSSLSTSCIKNAVIFIKLPQSFHSQFVDKLLNCRTIKVVGTTCNKSVELNNFVTSCQQAGNKQCEHILLTSCWNSITEERLPHL